MATRIVHDCSQAGLIMQIQGEVKTIQEEVKEMQKDIASLKPEVHGMHKILEGNGQKGLKEVVTILSANTVELGCQLSESKIDRKQLRDSINDLINYKSTLETTFKDKDRESTEREVRKTHLQWLVGIVITLILGIAALVWDVAKDKKEINILKEQIQTIK